MSKQTELAQVADTITVNSGNVGIGMSLPSAPLAVETGGIASLSSYAGHIVVGPSSRTSSSGDYSAGILFDQANGVQASGKKGASITGFQNGSDVNSMGLTFNVHGTDGAANREEAMRLDASGNLLVGKTSGGNTNTAGFEVQQSGFVGICGNNIRPVQINRQTSDGDIIEFRKDGSTVGSIGSRGSSESYISLGSSGLTGSATSGGALLPTTGGGTYVDNIVDLGFSGGRFDDIYVLSVISTSDRNEKQDIAELTDAEQRVAVAAKGLMRKFRWKNRVAEKGDDARIHFGIIAQDLQAAFAAEGLDAGDYAMFISTTWWEHDVEVPAVEAVAEVLDEEDNVVTEAVEAVDAYTRTDTYETQEEAPEGATERTRLGVRYSELLAFIIGAL